VQTRGSSESWARELDGGAHAVLLLNRGDGPANVRVIWEDLGLHGSHMARVRDLWAREDLGDHDGWYLRPLAPHACALLKVVFR
jgi:alpha-galactosidase